MKSGARALGVAESYREDTSTLCGAVVTGDGVVDGFGFRRITVGGWDGTDAIAALWRDVGRPDVRVLLISGVALAWYNIVDLDELAEAVPVPILSVTYEESDGLRTAIAEAFDGADAARRIDRLEGLPDRRRYDLEAGPVFVRAVNEDGVDVETTLRTLTRAGGRPEPVRVARLAARAADRYRGRCSGTEGD